MNCLEVRYRILRFLFGELSMVELAELSQHMDDCAGCGDCEVEREAIEKILGQFTSKYDKEQVPDDLRKRIFERITDEEDMEC